ncbi:MAG: hypothetical protein ABIF18_04470 [archaeon]
MEEKSMFWIAGISGAVGAGFGSVCGSNNLIVVFSVGAVIALLTTWGIVGFFK